jgi:hypothetical protein
MVKDVQVVLFNIYKMKFDSVPLKTLIKNSDQRNLVLPNFQRAYVWSLDKQKTLVSTFILDLPTGSFLLLKGKSDDFAAREVCFPYAVSPEKNCTYLLDGQQRFSTLKNAFTDLYCEKKPNEWREVWTPLFKQLSHRFFLRVNVPSSDYFGFKELNFKREIFKEIEPSNLIDYIETKQLMVKNENSFFHPGFNPVDSDGKILTESKRRAEIIEGMTEEEIIPLYELNSEKSVKLHSRVLSSIAIRRQNKLRDEIGQNSKRVIEILHHVDESIEDYIESEDEESINRTWITLATNWAKDVEQFLEGRINNQMAQIILEREEIARAFAIFEVINQPGTPLDEYDLIVAKAARNTTLPNLTERILSILNDPSFMIPESITSRVKVPKPTNILFNDIGVIDDKSPANDVKTRFLQMLSIISHCKMKGEVLTINHLKREKFLSLDCDEINDNYENAIISLLRAYTFLHIRCGIINISNIPYKLMIIPIANLFLDDKNWNSPDIVNKIEYWYWISLFSGYYKMNQNSRGFDDILILKNYIETNDDSALHSREGKVFEDEEYSDKKILCMETEFQIPKAIHQGILQYVISQQPRDFIDQSVKVYLNSWDIARKVKIDFNGTGKKEELLIEDHHICPLAEKTTIGESTSALRSNAQEKLNSPLNRTYISKYSNRIIGAFSPNKYFELVSDASKFGHCIPMPIEEKFKQIQGEPNETFYLRILKERYETLKLKLQEEMISLKS